MSNCIFCAIIEKKQPCDLVFEDNEILVFHDLYPKAEVHLLVVPKQHIQSLNEITPKEKDLIFHLITQIPVLAKAQQLSGFRTILNTGRAGGQIIDHLHFHLIGRKHVDTPLPGF